jgi:hypothetical protein
MFLAIRTCGNYGSRAGRPLQILYAFDPRRTAILLIGGDKTGLTDERFYGTQIPIADRLYDEHLEATAREEQQHD